MTPVPAVLDPALRTVTARPAVNLLPNGMQRHRHLEFSRFLNAVERAVPAGKLVHAILDNDAAHKHPKVLAWLGRHPRWTFHFTGLGTRG